MDLRLTDLSQRGQGLLTTCEDCVYCKEINHNKKAVWKYCDYTGEWVDLSTAPICNRHTKKKV